MTLALSMTLSQSRLERTETTEGGEDARIS